MPPEVNIDPAVTEAIPLVHTLVLAGFIVLGLLLWLLGRTLARGACAVCGLVIGGMGGWVIGSTLESQGAFLLPLVIGGAIAGALLAALLFRVWMGLSGAVLVALAAPLALFVWEGSPPPAESGAAPDTVAQTQPADLSDRLGEWIDKVSVAVKDSVGKTMNSDNGEQASPESADATQPATDAVREQVKAAYQYGSDEIRRWLDSHQTKGRVFLMALVAAGAGVGLLFGLAAPYVAASIESALIGSLLMLLPAVQLLQLHLPKHTGWLPQSQRTTVVTVGLITLLGILVQWIIFRKQTDK